jgi:S-adenosylmethionine/arginine decarboxylase-like enzyme
MPIDLRSKIKYDGNMILENGVTNDQFGLELIVDLYECDLEKISTEESIRNFMIKLCDEVIEMKRYGEPLIPHFGHESPITSGYSLVQLIETSLVSGHFSEYKRSVYLNIFSCKWFDTRRAARFSKIWFGAKRMKSKLVQRV